MKRASTPAVPNFPKVAAGMLRVGILTNVPPVLRELGHDPDRTLAEIGMNAAMLADPDALIPFREVGTLLQHCVTRTGCDHLGLLVGERGNAATTGMVGLLVRNAPDVGTALADLLRYLHHHDRGGVPSLEVAGGRATLGYHIYEPDVPAADQVHAGGIAIALRIMQDLCGRGWHPTEVHLPFRRPVDTEAYRRVFKAPLRFDAEQAALVFPARWLTHRLPGAAPDLQREMKSLLGARGQADLADHVRRAVRATLGSREISEEDLAHALNVSRRTLIRHLEAEGVSFSALVQRVRLEVACQLLRDTDRPVAEVAESLGYAGTSPFRRAFKRWTGQTPTEWRARETPGRSAS
jgi:AraC-like DNA-binding protein